METNDLAIRTLFAEFQEAVLKRFALEKDVSGEWTFISKKIKGKKYWYQQCYINGRPVQRYHLPSTPKNDADVLKKKVELSEKLSVIKKMLAGEQKRAAMLKRGGAPALDHLTSSVISALSDNYLTYKGGVLVGSHAFQAYAGMFGAAFEKSSLRTLDIDIACENTVTAYTRTPVNVGDILNKVEKGFRYVPSFSNKYPPSSFAGPSGIRVDIVTPLCGKQRGMVKIRNIVDAAATPLRFLNLLIKDPVDSVLMGTKGGIPVTVPQPVRYAVHKLIISSQRPVTESAKAAKDILQAGQLIQVCSREQPYELKRVFREAVKEGPKWKRYVEQGISRLSEEVQGIVNY